MVDVDRANAPSFGFAEALPVGVGAFHSHARHQLLYLPRGLVRLELEDRSVTLPSVRAAYVRAGVTHRVDVLRAARLCTVYAKPRQCRMPEAPCVVFGVTPLLRELFLEAPRFGPERGDDPLGASALRTLLYAGREAMGRAQPLWLPRARSPELMAATEHLRARLEDAPGVEACAAAAGVSPRTLARRFADELGLGFREYAKAARMIRAFELLLDPGVRVSDVAYATGFATPSAFTEAFVAFTGETPSAYRRSLAEIR